MYDAAELSQLPGLLAGELISSGRALDSTTRENICAILDAAIARAEVADSLAYERLENLLFVEQRADDAEIERDEAIARAEEAEASAAELIRANNELARLNVDLQVQVGDLEAALTSNEADENTWLDAYAESSASDGATIKRLLARVADLEAALAAERAAHQWRPVSQKPMHTLRYQVVLQHGQRFPAVDHVVYDAMSGWASPDAIYWRPIPPLPPAPQEPTP